MHNPYEDILPPEELKIGRTTAWIISVVFLLGIVVPPLVGNITEAGKEDGWVPIIEFGKTVRPEASTETGIAQRLREFESKLEQNSDFARALRRTTQARLTSAFSEGNNRTVIGKDGWLFFRPALQSLTGYGPILAEPSSVAKDPSRSSWKPALGAIKRFADQLHERGIELMLVPAPVKPMIYPEHLANLEGSSSSPLSHSDAKAFYASLRKAGITVIDIAETLHEMKKDDATAGPVFLKQDTHWHPRGMQAAVDAVAAELVQRPWIGEMPPGQEFSTETIESHHIGDLVEKLNLPDGSAHFAPEAVTLTRVIDPVTSEAFASDAESPVVVLGDSFVNIFHDPSLGFAVENTASAHTEEPQMIGAGFAQHLAMKVGMPLDVIAINGEASSGVREQFARRYDDEVRAKKAVIWVIAARDLFLSETPAKGLVRWDDVTFNSALRPEGTQQADPNQAYHAKGTITMKSAIPDPREATYRNSLFVVELTVENSDGDLPPGTEPGDILNVVLWGFKDRKYSKESNLKEGQTISVTLVDWNSKPELGTKTVADDSFNFDSPRWFATEVE